MVHVTLGGAFRQWQAQRSPRLLLMLWCAAALARLVIGGWRVRDAIVLGIFAVAQPFTEWLIHVYVLHWRPRMMFGRLIDPYAARSHRRHHQDPKDLTHVFIDIRVLYAAIGVGAVLDIAAWQYRPSIATAVLASTTLTALYEWTHYLIHTDYVPRHAPYRALWRAHRLHHFRNENYWYGVTSHLADRVLRTNPRKDDVPLSPTAVSLAHLAAPAFSTSAQTAGGRSS